MRGVRGIASRPTRAAKAQNQPASRGPRGNRPKPGAPGRGKREPHVLAQYLPNLLFLIVATGIGIALILIGNLLGPRRPDLQKLSPYECGFEAFEDARMKFDVRYYLVAILFILFDLEIAFLFPWAVALKDVGLAGFVAVLIFLTILVVGFVYEWKKGALDWE